MRMMDVMKIDWDRHRQWQIDNKIGFPEIVQSEIVSSDDPRFKNPRFVQHEDGRVELIYDSDINDP
jgi:hypothetical protein